MSDSPGDVRAEPPAPVPEAEEPDWAALVRRRRRALVGTWLGITGAYAALMVILSLTAGAWPTRYAWALLVVLLIGLVVSLWPLLSGARRARWTDRALDAVRIEHALQRHVSVGADYRDAVTEHAGNQASLAGAAILGYPLLFLLLAFLLFNDGDIPGLWALLGTLVAAALCGWALLASRRRGARARRWLAEPLPPER
jgi:hypothetical protein